MVRGKESAMRNAWFVLTGTSMIALALAIGGLAWNGAIPGTQAMEMTGSNAQMHGDVEHDHIHADCDDEMSIKHSHERMNSHSDCLFHSGSHSIMDWMTHGRAHHMDSHHGEHRACSTVDEDD